MELHGEKPGNSPIDEKSFIARAENEIKILSGEIKDRNWKEIWNSLCKSELTSSAITRKMSLESQETFKNLIKEVQEVFASEKESIEKELANLIQDTLDNISKKL